MAQVPAWILALLGVSPQNALYGTSGFNIMPGNSANNFIEGGDGGDILSDLFGGNDTLGYWNSDAGVNVNFSGLLPVVSGGDATGDVVLAGFENAVGSFFDDTLIGNAGANILVAGAGDDALNGGAGDDTLVGGAGTNTLVGGEGDDTAVIDWTIFDGVAPGQTVDGGTIDLGDEGGDTILFNSEPNATVGYRVTISDISSTESEFLVEQNVAGPLSAGVRFATYSKFQYPCRYLLTENNYIDASATQKSIDIETGSGDDTLIGGFNDDTLTGGDGGDTIYGNGGSDDIDGGGASDYIDGGADDDTLAGGSGIDTFAYNTYQESTHLARDTIIDFTSGDTIDLSAIDAKANSGGDQAFNFIGSSAFSGVSGQLRYAGGLIQGDVNGDAIADLEIQSLSGHTFTAGDFIL